MSLPVVPHGSWPSPLTAARVVAGAANPGEIRADGDDVWWSESRPDEGGRVQLVHHSPDGARRDALPDGFSARTRVHEYGGGAWAVHEGTLVFANADDQRLYRLDPAPDARPVPLTPSPQEPLGLRFADLWVDAGSHHVLAVREMHGSDRPAGTEGAYPVNDLVAIPLDGSAGDDAAAVRRLVWGADFYASPRSSVLGDQLAWVQWDDPALPWDATELRVAPLRREGGPRVDEAAMVAVAGGPTESVIGPSWLPDGSLTYLSDRTGWWNPYLWSGTSSGPVPLAAVEAEIGGPLWVFGLTYLAWLSRERFVCRVRADGVDRLAVGHADGRPLETLDLPFTEVAQVVSASGGSVLVVAGGATFEPTVARVLVASNGARATVELLRPARDLGLGADPGEWFSVPEAIEVPTTDDATTHALVYRPRNPTVAVPDGARPPLLVLVHGGPTSSARAQLNLTIQYWTTRGFCVADVNYRGSTGYGRPYRDALRGQWGIRDVEDCVAVARHLASRGEADPGALAIRGGSAGGFTTLAALTFHDTFTAGASHYGIADLAVLAADTHKFEARYLDGLIGPWPADADVYRARSPLHHTEGLSCPVAIFQGLEDAVVPPAQAELLVAALAEKGLPYAYVTFAGEQHGFRQAANIVRALEGELWFYGRVFGFEPAEAIEPLPGAGL